MVFKVEKNKNYTVMSNYHLRDKNLSLKAKGLLSFMLSLPDDWDYSLNGLCSICKESEGAIKSTLKELKDNGYLVIEKVRGEKGYFEYNYIIYEHPYKLEKEKNNPEGKNPPVDYPMVENHTQINTNEQSIKEQIDRIDKTINEDEKKISSSFSLEEHHAITKDLVEREYLAQDDVELYKYDKFFKEILKKQKFTDVISITHYIISCVKSRHFIDEFDNKIENKFGYLKTSIENNIEMFKRREIEWDDELGWFREVDNDDKELDSFYDDFDYEIT